MKPLRTVVAETAPFAAGQTKAIDVDVKGYLTQIDFRFTLNITAESPTTYAITGQAVDTLLRAVQSLKFTSSGSLDFYNVPHLRAGYYLAYLKSQGQAYCDSTLPTTSTAAADYVIEFSWHPGSNFSDPFDLSRCVPLRGLSNPQVQVTWGRDSDLGSGYTINSGSLQIIVYTQYLEKGESEADAFKDLPSPHILRPRLIPVTYSTSGTAYTDYGWSQDIPTGAYIRDVMLMQTDTSSYERVNTYVTGIAIRDNKGNTPFKEPSFASFTRMVAQKYYLPAAVTGVVIIPFKEITRKSYGLNMVGASKGDWTINFTTTTDDVTLYALYEAADMIDIDPTVVGE